MSQRISGYVRQVNDLYETPEWVTLAVIPHFPRRAVITEPACGPGKMAQAIAREGFVVVGIDKNNGRDLLSEHETEEAIVTNPPFGLATEFIEHALTRTKGSKGFVCMLLRTDFDHAKTRQHLFGACRQFAKKLVLTKRIVWFDRPGAAPSFNHAWFIWDHQHQGSPTLVYVP